MSEEQIPIADWTKVSGKELPVYGFKDEGGKLSFVIGGISDIGVSRLTLMPGWREVQVLECGPVGFAHGPEVRVVYKDLADSHN